MTNGPAIVDAVVVRDIGVHLATLAPFTGTVSDSCHYASLLSKVRRVTTDPQEVIPSTIPATVAWNI